MLTCAVIATVLQTLQSIDEDIHNLLTSLGRQVVEVREDSTHLHSCKIRSILNFRFLKILSLCSLDNGLLTGSKFLSC